MKQSSAMLDELREVIEKAWTADTSADPLGWSLENPAWGQCAVTALLIQDSFGGELLRADVDGISHYWNRLPSGEEVDLTRHQFRGTAVVSRAELRERSYVLSFPETRKRYQRLKSRIRGIAWSETTPQQA
ncbi:MAG: hypothetical protein R3C39_10840 [Dehalococcoidia bacterium]